MTATHVTERLREFIVENFLYTRREAEVGVDESLIQEGLIDSMGVIELITFVEDEFGIKIGDDDVTEENLGTIAALTRYILTKREATLAA